MSVVEFETSKECVSDSLSGENESGLLSDYKKIFFLEIL